MKQNHYERVFIVKLYNDAKEPNRVAAAAGFSVRENKIYIFKSKAMATGSRRRGERVPSAVDRAKVRAAHGTRYGIPAPAYASASRPARS